MAARSTYTPMNVFLRHFGRKIISELYQYIRPFPLYLPTYIPTYLPTYIPTYLPREVGTCVTVTDTEIISN